MNPLILLYTKLSGFSNDHIVYLNLLDHVLYCGKIWGFLSTKNRNNRLCFSCDSIEYTSKICGQKWIDFLLFINSKLITYESENQQCSWVEFTWQNRHVAIFV